MNDSFLKRARSQYMHAGLLISMQTGDEYTLNVVGYMLQQSVELLLKHILEMNGIRPPFAHDIADLVGRVCDCPNKLGLSNDTLAEIIMRADTFTKWESKTRYIKGFLLSSREIQYGMELMTKVFSEIDMYERAGHTDKFV